MSSTLISVIIPSYNRAEYVTETIESALNQTGVEVEVILVDDGSTDETAAVVKRSAPGWGERFRYVWQENSERCVARNHGLRYARGEFIAFLDSDDLWSVGHAQTGVRALAEQPRAAAVYSEHGLVDKDGRVIRERVLRPRRDETRFKRDLCLKRLILFPTEVLVRRSALEETFQGLAQVFDPEMVVGEDWLVWAELALRRPFIQTGKATAWRRLHPNSTWGDPARFVKHSRLATRKVIATGLPEAVGLAGQRIIAINETHCAYAYYLAGQWPEARRYLVSALREYRGVLREPDFWRVAGRLCVGKKFSRGIRAMRHRGQGKLIKAANSHTDL